MRSRRFPTLAHQVKGVIAIEAVAETPCVIDEEHVEGILIVRAAEAMATRGRAEHAEECTLQCGPRPKQIDARVALVLLAAALALA